MELEFGKLVSNNRRTVHSSSTSTGRHAVYVDPIPIYIYIYIYGIPHGQSPLSNSLLDLAKYMKQVDHSFTRSKVW